MYGSIPIICIILQILHSTFGNQLKDEELLKLKLENLIDKGSLPQSRTRDHFNIFLQNHLYPVFVSDLKVFSSKHQEPILNWRIFNIIILRILSHLRIKMN